MQRLGKIQLPKELSNHEADAKKALENAWFGDQNQCFESPGAKSPSRSTRSEASGGGETTFEVWMLTRPGVGKQVLTFFEVLRTDAKESWKTLGSGTKTI